MFLLYFLSMQKGRIGILRGGKNEHYEKSLNDGRDLILFLHENLKDQWQPIDIFVDKQGTWHIGGLPIIPVDLLHRVDAVWNTAHPEITETLKKIGIPCFANQPIVNILTNNRKILEEYLKESEIKIPRHLIFPIYQEDFDGPRERYSIKKAKEVHEKFSPPWIIKSFTSDSGMAIHVANTFPELVNAIEDGVRHNTSILIEEFISGKEIKVHSLSGFRDQEIYNFPIERVTEQEKRKIDTMSKKIFKYLGIPHYLKSEFKIDKKGRIYFTGLETYPRVLDSDLSLACDKVGAKMYHIIGHILDKMIKR